MKHITKKQREKLDKEAQNFKCLICDKREVRWNGEQWECGACGQFYGTKTEITIT